MSMDKDDARGSLHQLSIRQPGLLITRPHRVVSLPGMLFPCS